MPENPSKVGPKGQVTIPVHFRKKLGLSAGDLIQFIDNERGVLIKKVKIVDDDQGPRCHSRRAGLAQAEAGRRSKLDGTTPHHAKAR